MICKQCNGSGKTYNPGYGEENCCRCHGTGEIKQTEQEWLQTATTEQLAEALTKVVLDLISWNNDPKPSEVRNVLKAWLKQPHSKGVGNGRMGKSIEQSKRKKKF